MSWLIGYAEETSASLNRYDGGGYEGELAIFSLEGMEEYEPGSREFIQEAARRSLSDSEWGRIVISDRDEGAKFAGNFGEGNFNRGEYSGTKTFQMRPGDRFGAMLVPQGEVEEVFDNPDIGGAKRPLFSLSTANPEDGLQAGQIADVDGSGQTFVFEDLRVDGSSDRDYNDIIFRVKGAEGEAVELDEVIAADRDWRETELGQEILDYVKVDEPFPIAGDGGEILILSDRPDWSEAITEAVNQTAEQLWEFVHHEDFGEGMQLTFGENVEIEAAREAIVELVAGQDFPPIQILSQGELGNANAGFGIESNTIYLSHTFVESHLENPEIISQVLLEELGHFLDVKLETHDTPGDEGAILASLVQGVDPDDPQLQALQQENDSITLTLNGEPVTVEANDPGLSVRHYQDLNFGNLSQQQTENTPFFAYNWAGGSTVWMGTPPDGHSSIWTGRIEAPTTETYTLKTRADGRTRVWLKDAQGNWQKVVDGWQPDTGGERTENGTFHFNAGQQYEIQIEYQDDIGDSSIELLWESPSTILETISTQYLHPGDRSEESGVQAQGTGLKVKHYRDRDFGHLSQQQNENQQLNYDWGTGSTVWMGTPPDGHSSTWTGRIEAPTSDTYTLSTLADGRIRVWIKDEYGTWHKIVEGWEEDTGGTRERRGTVPFNFTAGQEYEIKIEYQDDTGNSNIELQWESEGQTRQVVPTRYLYPADLAEEPGVQAQGTGFKADYYNALDFSHQRFSFEENEANRDWGDLSPSYLDMPQDNWGGIWTGQIEAPSTDLYNFSTRSDGKVKFWLRRPGGEWQTLIDAWESDPNTSRLNTSPGIFLTAGEKYDFKVEFQEEIGKANLELLWENNSRTRQVIPTKYVYPVYPEYPPQVQAQGTGLNGLAFNGIEPGDTSNLGIPVQRIDFDWGEGNPINGSFPNDNWSARFTGKIEAPYNEDFTLVSRANGGSRVWVRDPDTNLWYKVIDDWTESYNSVDTTGTVPFAWEAGQKYDIQIDYKDEGGDAEMKLLWESASQGLSVVPQEFLYPETIDTSNRNLFDWSGTVDVGASGLYTFEADLEFPITLIIDGKVYELGPGLVSLPLILSGGTIDVRLLLLGDPLNPPWPDTPENEFGPPIGVNVRPPRRGSGEGTGGGISFPWLNFPTGWWHGGSGGSGGPGGSGGYDPGDKSPVPMPQPDPNYEPELPTGEPLGTGLFVEYFEGLGFSNLKSSGFVDAVNVDWDWHSPIPGTIAGDDFSVRYSGTIKVPETAGEGAYRFYVDMDGSLAQLSIDGVSILEVNELEREWDEDKLEYGSSYVTLKPGQKYQIQLDYADTVTDASVALWWEGPGLAKQIVQTRDLYPSRPPGQLLVNDSGDGFKVGRSANMLKALSHDFYEYYDNVKVSVRSKGNTYGEFLQSPSGAQGNLLWSGSLGKNEMLGMQSYVELLPRGYEEMFGGVENLQNDRLYGTELEVEYELFDGSQSLGTVTEPFHVYRWVDAIGQDKGFWDKNKTTIFHEKTVDGLSEFTSQKKIEWFVPSSVETQLIWNNSDLKYGESNSNHTVILDYNPDIDSNGLIQTPISIKVKKNDQTDIDIGTILAQGFRFVPQAQSSSDNINLILNDLSNFMIHNSITNSLSSLPILEWLENFSRWLLAQSASILRSLWHYWFGNHEDVNLEDWELLWDYKRTSVVQNSIEEFKEIVEQAVRDEIQTRLNSGILTPSNPNFKMTEMIEESNRVVLDVEPTLFIIAHHYLHRDYDVDVSVIFTNNQYSGFVFNGDMMFSIRDAFEDILDLNDSQPGNQDLPGGKPYDIVASWKEPISGSGI